MPEQLTVLRAITRLNIGGPAIHAILLTRGLNGGRFRSMLVSGQEGPTEGSMRDLATGKAVAPLSLAGLGREVSPLHDLLAVRQAYALICRLRPTIVHTHLAKAGTVVRLAAKLAGVPIILHTYHGHVFHSYFSPLKTRLFLNIERALGSLSDRLIAVGEKQRRELIGYGLAPAEKIVAVPLGLEIEPMLDVERERGRLRTELGLSEDEVLVGIVARLVPVKAHEVFFDAAERIARSVPKARFLVIGDGERRGELERLVGQLGLSERTRFLGWRRDMRGVYADLDVVALSSLNEGSPVAIIEAMAAGRPVVASDVGGVSEVVEHGRSGLLVPRRDPAALAAAVIDLVRDPAGAARLGAAARRAVFPKYASSRLVEDIERLYLELAWQKGLCAV
jgi:glycosyltransferase involved in cell wall biosynthesis